MIAIICMAAAVALLLLFQSRLYLKMWNKNLSAALRFSMSKVSEGDKIELFVELSNAKPLPLPWVTVRYRLNSKLTLENSASSPTSGMCHHADLFSIGLYKRITRKQDVTCLGRGYFALDGLELVSSNIFLSDKLVFRLPCSESVTVYPSLIPTGRTDVLYRRIIGDIEVKRFTNPDPFSFRGIREYAAGDDPRYFNFSASAKQGELMVNVAGPTASSQIVILYNAERYSAWTNEFVLEDGIRLAASLSNLFCADGIPVALHSTVPDAVTRGKTLVEAGSGTAHGERLMEAFARMDLSLRAEPMADILDGLWSHEPLYVLISSYDGENLEAAFRRMQQKGLDVRWIIPAESDIRPRVAEDEHITRWEVSGFDGASDTSAFNAG